MPCSSRPSSVNSSAFSWMTFMCKFNSTSSSSNSDSTVLCNPMISALPWSPNSPSLPMLRCSISISDSWSPNVRSSSSSSSPSSPSSRPSSRPLSTFPPPAPPPLSLPSPALTTACVRAAGDDEEAAAAAPPNPLSLFSLPKEVDSGGDPVPTARVWSKSLGSSPAGRCKGLLPLPPPLPPLLEGPCLAPPFLLLLRPTPSPF
mmetsp:Transcript_41392/g.76595  ORF Transcript_41392/g.76595 Transcript_41392/m.76595 type:complete len:203 (-) Transcript_41392:472-1080(-)